MKNLIDNIGLCRRAGKLTLGFDSVKDEIIGQTACVVLVARDVSEKTVKEIEFWANKHNIEVAVLPLEMEQMQHLFKRRVGVAAITDSGFAGLIKKSIASCT